MQHHACSRLHDAPYTCPACQGSNLGSHLFSHALACYVRYEKRVDFSLALFLAPITVRAQCSVTAQPWLLPAGFAGPGQPCTFVLSQLHSAEGQFHNWLQAPLDLDKASVPAHFMPSQLQSSEKYYHNRLQAPLDLDNLHLADLEAAPALEAGYELEALLLTGSCIDIAASSRNAVCPPNTPSLFTSPCLSWGAQGLAGIECLSCASARRCVFKIHKGSDFIFDYLAGGTGSRQVLRSWAPPIRMDPASCWKYACWTKHPYLKLCCAVQVTPRGVQLHLGTAAQPRLVDTLVMANLGYFQLKAAPGVFALRLAPGRSAALYVVDNSTAGAVAEDTAQARAQTEIMC